MGLSPEEFAGLTPYQFGLKCEGFKDAQKMIESNFRKLAWITFAMQADPKAIKGITIDNIWPIKGGKSAPKPGYSKQKVASYLKKFRQLKNIGTDARI